MLIAPVRLGGRVAGALSLTRTSPDRPYTEDDRRRLEELADRAALAIANARSHARTQEAEAHAQQQAARMAALAQVSKALTEAGFDQQTLLETIMRQVVEVMGGSCALRLLSADRQQLPAKAFWDTDPERRAQMAEILAAEPPGIMPLYQPLIETGQPLFYEQDIAEQVRPLSHSAHADYSERHGLSASQFVALRVGGEVVGALSCARAGKPYTAEDHLLFQELADRASVAIEKARLFVEVREASRRKDEFLAMLGHELRNPIAALLNAHRAAAAKPDEATMSRAHEILDRQIRHMSRLVDDLLDVSRITGGKVLLQREPVELGRLIRETCADLNEMAERSSLTLNLDCPDEAASLELWPELWVDGDRTRLAQMLTNLITNAVKFTNEGGRITVGAKPDGDGRVAVSVRDTGIGIEPQMLPRVFDTFTQADRSLDRSRGGLGLGLALVKGLAELHGGEVAAHSNGVGRGSAFTFRLPLVAAPPDDLVEADGGAAEAQFGGDSALDQDWPIDLPLAELSRLNALTGAATMTLAGVDVTVAAPSVAPPIAPEAAPGPLRALVIDDNQDSADMVCMMLNFYGHTSEAVYSGVKGLEVIERMQLDAVCCDIGLPEMDGYEVARELRRRGYAGLLIAVSGYGQEEDKRLSREAGFDAHLVKPVEPEHLDQALKALARR